jgi:hypothetical protein
MKRIETASKEQDNAEASVKASGTYSYHCFEELTLKTLRFAKKMRIYFSDIHNKQRFYP